MRFLVPFLSFYLCLIGAGYTQEVTDWTWGGPIDPLQEKVEIDHYEINLEFVPEKQWIQGSVKVSFDCGEKLDTLRLNLIKSYEVTRVEIHQNEAAEFKHFGDTLDIYIPDGCAEQATIYYQGKTPIASKPPWTGGFTWTKDDLGNHWMGLSSQNEGAKIFMPCLDHPSSEPSRGIDLHLTAPEPYFVASNGVLVGQKQTEDKITYHWATQYPINNYNINFTLGIFHEESKLFSSISGEQVPMVVYSLAENKDKAPMLLSVLENSTRTHEKFFGEFPFPKDKIAVVETPYLGMEHQTINGYGNNYQFVRTGEVFHDWLLHHELGHEWWGNKVSVADWADFWIHEGLCTYGDWLFYLEHAGEEAYRKRVNDHIKLIKNERPIVGPKDSTSDETYQLDIYYKGAYVIHTLRYILGDEVLFPLLKAFLSDERFTYHNLVNTKDFTDFVQQFSGKDLGDFFDLYLHTADLPEVKVVKQKKDRYKVSLKNVNLTLPIDIHTSEGIQRVEISSEPVIVTSKEPIKVDPDNWYLKKQ